LFLAVARLLWYKPAWIIALGAVVFLTVEISFFAANLTKVVHGGWLPLAIAVTVFTMLMTWHKGRAIMTAKHSETQGEMRDFIEQLDAHDFPVQSVPGVGVFLNENLQTVPLALRANVDHNHVLHDHVIIVSVQIERVPHVPDPERIVAEPKVLFSGATGDPLGATAQSITLLTLRFGFLDEPDVPSALRLAAARHLIAGDPNIDQATYFLSQITILPSDASGMAAWRKKLFITMARNAGDPVKYFRLPDTQTFTTSGRVQL
jgi:KUP system potassium uptake protein